MAESGVVDIKVVGDRTHDHFAGIDTDTDFESALIAASEPFGITAHLILHRQRGVTGAHGMILMGKRRAEQRHDSIAQHLIHRALIMVHGIHHDV